MRKLKIKAFGTGLEDSAIANDAFNCRWNQSDPNWSWKVYGEPNCTAWLYHIYSKNATHPYSGDCPYKIGDEFEPTQSTSIQSLPAPFSQGDLTKRSQFSLSSSYDSYYYGSYYDYNPSFNYPSFGHQYWDYSFYNSYSSSYYSWYDYSSYSSPSSYIELDKLIAYHKKMDLLEDILTIMTSKPIEIHVELELVSLNAIELADSTMDTTIVLYFSWTG